MLTRRSFSRIASVILTPSIGVTAALAAAAPGLAQDGGAGCDGVAPVIDGEAQCIAWARGPVTDGAPLELAAPAGTGSTTCLRPEGVDLASPAGQLDRYGPREIPCVWTGVAGPDRDGTHRGYYTRVWDCYVQPRPRQTPSPEMVGYAAHGGADGLVYLASCFPPPPAPVTHATDPRGLGHWRTGPHGGEPDPDGAIWGGTGQLVVLPEAPPPAEPEPSIAELWVEAVNQLAMRGPEITTAPPVRTGGLVHLPTWLWTANPAQTWPDRLQATAAAGGVRVDAHAEPSHLEWDMGDGQPPLRCDGPGVAWGPESDVFHPPADACRHTYQRASRTQPDGAFHILAMTTWRVWWEINGEYDNELQIQVGTTATYQVNELQVLTR